MLSGFKHSHLILTLRAPGVKPLADSLGGARAVAPMNSRHTARGGRGDAAMNGRRTARGGINALRLAPLRVGAMRFSSRVRVLRPLMAESRRPPMRYGSRGMRGAVSVTTAPLPGLEAMEMVASISVARSDMLSMPQLPRVSYSSRT